jgi:hypothetical protein
MVIQHNPMSDEMPALLLSFTGCVSYDDEVGVDSGWVRHLVLVMYFICMLIIDLCKRSRT